MYSNYSYEATSINDIYQLIITIEDTNMREKIIRYECYQLNFV